MRKELDMLKHLLRSALLAAAFLITGSPLWAGDIVDTGYVANASKTGAIIWDLRDADDYAAGHIPGAVNIGNAAKVLRNPNTEDFIATAEVQKILNAAGIDLGKEVIVYTRKGDPYAHWGLTIVRYFGGKNGKVYHGGLDDWKAAKLPVATEPTKLAAVDQKLTVDPTVQVFLDDVLKVLNDPNVQLVDVRTPKEYSGDDIRALRGGHVPGAVNIPYEQNWVDPDTGKKLKAKQVKTRDGMALKSKDELAKVYGKLDPNKETVVMCQSSVRASNTANVLRELGFKNVKVFEESWLGYGNRFDAPAENVQFLNVGALRGEIAGLEADVARLEAQVEALQKAANK
jgi:thiosulfate/3-mercaptopyruvate sulfurtransferase